MAKESQATRMNSKLISAYRNNPNKHCGWAFGAAVALLLGTPAAPVRVPGFEFQLHSISGCYSCAHQEATGNGSSTWVPATSVGAPD